MLRLSPPPLLGLPNQIKTLNKQRRKQTQAFGGHRHDRQSADHLLGCEFRQCSFPFWKTVDFVFVLVLVAMLLLWRTFLARRRSL